MSRTASARPTRQSQFAPYAFLLPALAAILAVIIYPLGYSLYLALHNVNLNYLFRTPKFVALANFKEALLSSTFQQSTAITFIFSGAAVAAEFVLGLAFALLFEKPTRGSSVFRSLLIIPVVLTPAVIGLFWKYIYNPNYGVATYLFGQLGFQNVLWVAHPSTSLLSVILVDIWEWTPFMFLILLAGLQSVPDEVNEAALLDGVGGFRRLRYVTLPLIKGLILVALLIRFMDAFRTFDTIFVLNKGGPGFSSYVLSILAFESGLYHGLNVSKATAISYIILLIILGMTSLLLRVLRRE